MKIKDEKEVKKYQRSSNFLKITLSTISFYK